MADDPASATLDDIRVRVFTGNYDDTPSLLAAVEAVLKAADGWRYIHSARCAREVREAITAALSGTGTQLGEDGEHG